MRQQTTNHTKQHVPVPSGYLPDQSVDIQRADLKTARNYYRLYGCPAAYTRWNELSLAANEAANTLEQVAITYFNAPEGSEVGWLIFKRFDKLSLELVEATTDVKALIGLHRRLGTSLANDGQAELLLNSKLAKLAGWK